MEMKKEILRQLGRYALQSMTHRHVFVTPALKSFATTKNIGPIHSHKVYIAGRWIEVTSVRSGPEHRHKIVVNGKEVISGLPIEGPSTDLF